MIPPLPPPWRRVLGEETREPYMRKLYAFLEAEAERHEILPAAPLVFRALELTPPGRVKVVLLGQDPYPTPGHAEGMAFSVAPGVKPPVSLRNVFEELHADTGCPVPTSGHLAAWAERGVLLLNTVLTVRAGESGSHRGHGWERFTDGVIRAVVRKRTPVAFLLWGRHAQEKAPLVEGTRHTMITGSHPSFYSARRGFFGSRPFTRANASLQENGRDAVDWCLG